MYSCFSFFYLFIMIGLKWRVKTRLLYPQADRLAAMKEDGDLLNLQCEIVANYCQYNAKNFGNLIEPVYGMKLVIGARSESWSVWTLDTCRQAWQTSTLWSGGCIRNSRTRKICYSSLIVFKCRLFKMCQCNMQKNLSFLKYGVDEL